MFDCVLNVVVFSKLMINLIDLAEMDHENLGKSKDNIKYGLFTEVSVPSEIGMMFRSGYSLHVLILVISLVFC